MIDYVLEKTGQEKLHYVGHSMGTTGFFVAMDHRPEYQDKVIMAHLLAPVAYVENMISPISWLAPFIEELEVIEKFQIIISIYLRLTMHISVHLWAHQWGIFAWQWNSWSDNELFGRVFLWTRWFVARSLQVRNIFPLWIWWWTISWWTPANNNATYPCWLLSEASVSICSGKKP